MLAGCSGDGGSKSSRKTLLIAINAPFSRTPYVGQTIANGAALAAQGTEIKTKEGSFMIRFKRYDSGLSARTAVANVRRAVTDGAIAIIDEGTGINASWRVAGDAKGPTCVALSGGRGLLASRPPPPLLPVA